MDQYIDQIGMFIEANQVWAGPITFLLTLENPWCWWACSFPPRR